MRCSVSTLCTKSMAIALEKLITPEHVEAPLATQ